ncbi:hypothetical protein [Paractinoplanes abujensis]|uniref:Uncharacterized protein n=1 Tax=Paractinoplanes abujensis TaxID=882441 RepID=A0A7W7G734_9ACTN|nr:hypothetical protein [Actinoplanes abujensis]MBB4698050.1 hypothetical protein [Actinoplanes abujensis]
MSTPSPSTAEQKQKAVEGKAKKDEKVNVKRPLPQTKVWAAASELKRSETKVGADHIRITSAAQDLTGQHELSWVAGEADKHGDVECTNRIRLSQGAPVVVRPTLLVCWRTSARQSVFTISTNTAGRPSWKLAADRIDKEWKRLTVGG